MHHAHQSTRRDARCRIGLALSAIPCLLACASPQPSLDTDGEPGPAQGTYPEAAAPPLHVAAHDAAIRAAMDATPSPDAERVYYTALHRDARGDDTPGVFAVAAEGGEIESLAEGGALTAPVGISVSLDGERVFVADSAAPAAEEGAGNGAILVLDNGGGEPRVVPGTEGYAPRGLVIARIDARERVFFTGEDPNSGQAGVFQLAPAGGTAEPVVDDAGLTDPEGVAVAGNGDVYVVDAFADAGLARVLRIRDGELETIADHIGVGFPAGIAVSQDGATLLVSGIDPITGHDVVYVIDTASLQVSVVSKAFSKFSEAAGLHRAHNTDVFAWADSEADESGTVYTLEL